MIICPNRPERCSLLLWASPPAAGRRVCRRGGWCSWCSWRGHLRRCPRAAWWGTGRLWWSPWSGAPPGRGGGLLECKKGSCWWIWSLLEIWILNKDIGMTISTILTFEWSSLKAGFRSISVFDQLVSITAQPLCSSVDHYWSGLRIGIYGD